MMPLLVLDQGKGGGGVRLEGRGLKMGGGASLREPKLLEHSSGSAKRNAVEFQATAHKRDMQYAILLSAAPTQG